MITRIIIKFNVFWHILQLLLQWKFYFGFDRLGKRTVMTLLLPMYQIATDNSLLRVMACPRFQEVVNSIWFGSLADFDVLSNQGSCAQNYHYLVISFPLGLFFCFLFTQEGLTDRISLWCCSHPTGSLPTLFHYTDPCRAFLQVVIVLYCFS